MKKRDERRLAENEVIFKQINKDVDGFLHDVGVQNLLVTPFYCECSSLECRERIELTPAEYERIHKSLRHFIVLPGHQIPAIEQVIEQRDNFNVVEKKTEIPSPSEVRHRLKELK
jgi:hypothetical protein